MGPLTAAEFEAYGRAVVQPGYDYFTKLFVASNGEMWGIKMAYRGATVLDALKLATMDLATASLLVDNLEHFNFPEFTLDFRGHLKAELPLLQRVMATRDAPFVLNGYPRMASQVKQLQSKVGN